MSYLRFILAGCVVFVLSFNSFGENFVFCYDSPGTGINMEINTSGIVTVRKVPMTSSSFPGYAGTETPIGTFNITDLWADYFISCIRTFMEAYTIPPTGTPTRELVLSIKTAGETITNVLLTWGPLL
jgi:hypothetical protein